MNVAFLLDGFYDYVHDALQGANDTETGTFIRYIKKKLKIVL